MNIYNALRVTLSGLAVLALLGLGSGQVRAGQAHKAKVTAALADTPPLTAQKPIVIPGGPGGFDWMRVDANSDRVFATHKGAKTVAIVDLKTEKALDPVTVGTAQGIAIDWRDNTIFLGNEEEHTVVRADRFSPTGRFLSVRLRSRCNKCKFLEHSNA